MKSFLRLSGVVALSCLAVEAAARAVGYSPKEWIMPYKREALQDIVCVGWQLGGRGAAIANAWIGNLG